MQRFRFPLESAMQYRQFHIDMQRAKLESLYAELRRLNTRRETLSGEKDSADKMVKGVEASCALSLMALDNFSRRLTAQQSVVEHQRSECFRLISEQQQRLIAAQRDYDLLAKLRERKVAEWQRAATKEQEELASEVHLARVASETSRNRRSRPDRQ